MDLTTLEIVWQRNPLTRVKLFGKLSYILCTKEMLAIMKALVNKPQKLINSRRELYGARRHIPTSHMYMIYATSTDEGQLSPERFDVSVTLE